jgi:hypothetical protein
MGSFARIPRLRASHARVRRPDETRAMGGPATRDGTCSGCGEPYRSGDRILLIGLSWAGHATCVSRISEGSSAPRKANPCDADDAVYCGSEACSICAFRGRGPNGGE